MPRIKNQDKTWLKKLDKKCFENMRDMAINYNKIKSVFDNLIEERFGYHYSDRDIDEIIDVLDYGQDDCEQLTYQKFVKLMNEKKPEAITE